jgi:hypothetical protein
MEVKMGTIAYEGQIPRLINRSILRGLSCPYCGSFFSEAFVYKKWDAFFFLYHTNQIKQKGEETVSHSHSHPV